jgi:hypothetical protein
MSAEIRVGDRFRSKQHGSIYVVIEPSTAQRNDWKVLKEGSGQIAAAGPDWLLTACIRLPPKKAPIELKVGDRYQSTRTDIVYVLQCRDVDNRNIWIARREDDVLARERLILESELQDPQRYLRLEIPPPEPIPVPPPPPEPTREQVERELADREYAQMRREAYEQDRDPNNAILAQLQAPLTDAPRFLLRGRG